MKIGLTLPQAGQGEAARENVINAARQAEENRFDSVWVFERLLWPTKPQTPYPATPDGSLPIQYQDVLDPLETLTFVAASTKNIRLGTSVVDVLFHNPVVLARRFATLDLLSEGRSIAGLGIGWSKDEFQASNVPFNNRGKRANEFVQILKKVWTDDIVEFKGQFYNVPASKIGPKPVQKPHMPVYQGGFSPNAFDRFIEYDLNGWLPVMGMPLDQFENMLNIIKDKTIKHSKNPSQFDHVLLTYPNVIEDSSVSSKDSKRFPMTGTIDEIGGDITKIKELGIGHIIFGYNFSPIFKDVDKMIEMTREFSKFAK